MNEWAERFKRFLKIMFPAFLTPGDFKEMFQILIAIVTEVMVSSWASIMELAGPQMIRGVVRAFTVNRGVWAAAIATFSEELTGEKVNADAIVKSKAGAPLTEFIRAFAVPIGEVVFNTIAPDRFPTPAVGRENAQALFALATRFGMQGWYAHSVAEIFSLGHFRSIGDLPEAIERSFGITRILRLVLKPIVKTAIADPLTEYYNRLYQSQFLTVGEATSAWEKGFMTDEQFYDTMAARGYNASRAAVLLNLHQKTIAVPEAVRMWRLRMIDDAKLLAIIRSEGYGEVRADLISTLVKSEKGEKILDEIATTVRSLWRRGRLTDEELRGALRDAYWTETEISLVLAHEQLLTRERATLTVAEELEAFQHAIIPEGDMRRRLRGQGYVDADIDVLLAVRARRLTEAQVIELFIRRRITRAEAETRLARLGYPDAEIPLLLDLHTRTLSEGQILDALRERLINVATARAQLLALGFPDDQVELLLAFSRKELSVQDVQAAILRGLLTESEARTKFLVLGFSPADAELLVALRFRILTRGEIMDGYEAGLLTRREAVIDLEAQGHTPDEADLLLRLVEARIARQGKKPPKK